MRNRFENKNTIVGLIIIFALLFFCGGVSIYQRLLPVVTIKVDSVTIRQEEALPDFAIHAEYSGKENILLDETSAYTVSDFLKDLNGGIGYQVSHEADSMAEGIYEIDLDFSKDVKEKLVRDWNRKIRYRVEAGTVTVLNKYGDWEEGKFRFLDGTYASGWTNLGDETYYFDETGNRVTGEHEINGVAYHFKKDGKFDKEKNPFNPNRPMVALTFDDGPSIYTMPILEALQAHGAKASFFMVGTNVNKYPDAVKKMYEMGCDIGNHTTNHARLSVLSPEGIAAEIQTTNTWIQNIIGQGAALVRPPYGAYNGVVQSVAGAPLILWSVDTRDWESRNAVLVRDHVLNSVKDGDIILMHDLYESTLQATMELIPQLIERGYQLVTVSELARAKGVTLQSGAVYKIF